MRRGKQRGLGFVLATMVLASSFVGCPLLKKKAAPDAGDDEDETAAASVADATTVAVTGVGAKNEANVLRYEKETPLPNEPAVIGGSGTKARNFPGNGPEVAFLQKGTPVVKIAQYFSTGTLVMFDDPSGDGSKLMGWVTPSAFDTAAPPPDNSAVVPPRVDAGGAPVVPKDAGTVLKDAGTVQKDAGTPTLDAGGGTAVKDAGAPPKDAGAPPKDAGGGGNGLPPEPPKGTLAVAPTNGKCPQNWALTEGMCRRKCAADAECPRGTKCATKSGTKVCSSDH